MSTDYETLLATLASEIESVETTLLDIKARKRRTIGSVLQIMISLWVFALVVLWLVSPLFWRKDWWSRSSVLAALLLGSPLVIAVLYRGVGLWFGRLERAQEQHLQLLRRQQREKINEIKKATDFDHLRRLLDRYDTESRRPSAGPEPTRHVRARSSISALRKHGSMSLLQRTKSVDLRPTTTPKRQPTQRPEGLAPPIVGLPIQGVPHIPCATPPAQHPRGWFDKVADLILGTDPYGATPEEQQYALICRHCFRHNGLVPKSELSEIQYICPHCHAFNSRRPSSRPVSSPFARPDIRTASMDNTGPLPLAADTLHDLTKAEASRFYGGEAGDEPPQGGVYHGVPPGELREDGYTDEQPKVGLQEGGLLNETERDAVLEEPGTMGPDDYTYHTGHGQTHDHEATPTKMQYYQDHDTMLGASLIPPADLPQQSARPRHPAEFADVDETMQLDEE